MRRGLPIGPFALAAAITACVGATVGAERSALPLAAGLGSAAWGGAAFVAAFGISKAVANLAAGPGAVRFGRRRTLLAGWLVAVPVPFALAFTTGGWPIVVANVLLGVSQGLCWTTALVMQVDLAGPRRRGFAAGVNEFAGYAAVGAAAYAAAIAAGLLDARRGP
ncbi:MAG TPA: MFS transporter, partial [Candidatus Limnocylindria bacterium]